MRFAFDRRTAVMTIKGNAMLAMHRNVQICIYAHKWNMKRFNQKVITMDTYT